MARIGRSHPAKAYIHLPPPIRPAPAPPVVPGSKFLDQFVAGYGLQVKFGFGADVTADPGTWTLTEVTSDLLQPEPPTPAISITGRGRLDERSAGGPSQCQFTLKNLAGNYTPRRRQGSHWPYMKVGLPCQIKITTASATYERFSGYVTDIEPGWDETGNYAITTFTAFGMWQRLSQGDNPLRSALTRAIPNTSPVAYWTMEDGSSATSAASGVAGGSPLVVTAPPVAFAAGGAADGSAALVDFSGGGTMAGPVPAGASSTAWRVEFSARWDTFSGGNYTAIMQWTTQGDIGLWEIDATQTASPGGGLYIQAYPSPSSSGGFVPVVSNVAVDDGGWHRIRIDAAKSGSNIVFTVSLDGVTVISQTLTGQVFGRVTGVIVNPMGFYSTVSQPGFGQLAVWAPWSSSIDTVAASQGYAGEDPVTRATRLCTEEGIAFAADSTSIAAMGPQTVSGIASLLRECEAADGGVMDEANFGLYLRTVNGRLNGSVAFTPTLQQIVHPWRPVENDLTVRNDVTVSQSTGSTARYVQPTGEPYAPSGAGGSGTHSDSKTVNLNSANDLIQPAGWEVALGTVDADRYPAMGINLAARTALLASWLPCGVSSRMTVSGAYPTGATDPPDLMVEGWSEQLSKMVYAVQVNTSPSAPWLIGVLDTDVLDYDGVTLHAGGWDGVSGSIVVDIAAGNRLITTTAGDYPVDLNVDGQRVTVSACAGGSSPQTLTVSVASVNGVSVSHAAGAAVSVWAPIRIGL